MQHCTFCYRLFALDLRGRHDIDVAPWGIALARAPCRITGSSYFSIQPLRTCHRRAIKGCWPKKTAVHGLFRCHSALTMSRLLMPDRGDLCQLSKRAATARHVQLAVRRPNSPGRSQQTPGGGRGRPWLYVGTGVLGAAAGPSCDSNFFILRRKTGVGRALRRKTGVVWGKG